MASKKRQASAEPSDPSPEAERHLPHSIEAERALLGAILLNPAAMDGLGPLKATEFYRHAHGLIFASMLRLHDASAAIDLATLRNDLIGRGYLDECGGPAYISALIDGVPLSKNFRHYVVIVKEKAVLRGIITACNKLVARAYAADEPAVLILSDADRAVSELQSGQSIGDGLVSLKDSTDALLADLEYRNTHRGELRGSDTGFASINECTSGWQIGDVAIIAARPSIGKTTFVCNSVVPAARAGAKVAIFSFEMRAQQLHYRFLSSISGIPLERLCSGNMMTTEYAALSDAVAEMGRLPIYIQDTTSMSAWDIRAACRRLRTEHGLDLVVIDYIQLMPGTIERRGATRNDEMTDISRRLKVMAGELKVSLLVLSQLKRGEGRPKLSDLRESGALEQDADLVCFLHRKNHRAGGLTEFIIDKQRNGPGGTMNLTLDRDIVLFTDAGASTPEEQAAAEQEDKAVDHKKRKQTFARRAHSN